jgi:hypothetical protein
MDVKGEFMRGNFGCYAMTHGSCHFVNTGTVKVVLCLHTMEVTESYEIYRLTILYAYTHIQRIYK